MFDALSLNCLYKSLQVSFVLKSLGSELIVLSIHNSSCKNALNRMTSSETSVIPVLFAQHESHYLPSMFIPLHLHAL